MLSQPFRSKHRYRYEGLTSRGRDPRRVFCRSDPSNSEPPQPRNLKVDGFELQRAGEDRCEVVDDGGVAQSWIRREAEWSLSWGCRKQEYDPSRRSGGEGPKGSGDDAARRGRAGTGGKVGDEESRSPLSNFTPGLPFASPTPSSFSHSAHRLAALESARNKGRSPIFLVRRLLLFSFRLDRRCCSGHPALAGR